MSTIYVDPSAGVDGSGSQANPRNTLVGVTPAASDIVLMKSGTTYAGGVPSSVLAAGSITLGAYGTGAKPIIDGGIVVTPTAVAGNAGFFEYAQGSNLGGNMKIDGVVQKWVQWTTNIATTFPLMAEGTFTYDYNAFKYYTKPVGGSLSGKVVKVSNVINLISGSGVHFNTIRDLEFAQGSKHAVAYNNMRRFSVLNCVMRHIGGYHDNSANFFAGNGVEIGGTAIDALVEDCVTYDIFDSAFTAQLYGGQTGAQHSQNHEFNRCESYRCGFSAFEFSALDTFETLNGCYVNSPIARDTGTSAAWAVRPAQGNAISALSGASGSGGVSRVFCDSPDFQDQLFGVRNSFNTKPIVISGTGRIVGNQTNRVKVEQLGSPTYARAVVALSTGIVTDGADSLGGYADALVTF